MGRYKPYKPSCNFCEKNKISSRSNEKEVGKESRSMWMIGMHESQWSPIDTVSKAAYYMAVAHSKMKPTKLQSINMDQMPIITVAL